MKFIFFVLFTSIQLMADTKSFREDLDGDGKLDTIKLIEKNNISRLYINRSHVDLKDGFSSYKVVDINKRDKVKEISIVSSEGMDFSPVEIYRYDGRNIQHLGTLHSPEFPGNGFSYSNEWMGFWMKKIKFTLNQRKQKLEPSPQELFYVGINAKVKKSFPIYQKHSKSTPRLGYLLKDSKISILVSYTGTYKGYGNYETYWYLIKSSTGLVGWIDHKTVIELLDDIPWAG